MGNKYLQRIPLQALQNQSEALVLEEHFSVNKGVELQS